MINKLLPLVVLVVSLSVVSCSASTQPDDVLHLRGGLGYSGNFGEDGWPVPTPQVESAQVELRIPARVIQVWYRDYIETKAGQKRNIIFHVTHLGLVFTRPAQVNIEPVALPAGMKCRVLDPWLDTGIRSSDGALQIDIARGVAPGEYSFEFNVRFDGNEYGRLPCTIKVVQ